jgi:GTP-binding protein
VEWKGHRINIVDTPGHADFGGEVERILHMVDGAIVLVDAAEGPMPQTKFVVGKALKLGLKPIVAVNKIDKPERAPTKCWTRCSTCLPPSMPTDEQLDFPILYGSAKQGWMANGSRKSRLRQHGRRCSTWSWSMCRRRRSEEGPFRFLGDHDFQPTRSSAVS